MPRDEDFRGKLAERKQKKRDERKAPVKSYGCLSGTTAGDNPLLGMIACAEGGLVRNARLFVPEIEEDAWAYTVQVGTGLTFYTVKGPDKLKAGFTELGDLKLLPNEVAIVRAHYSGEAVRDFEYCLDYAIEVKHGG